MSIPALSRLQPVPLRDAWPHEAGSFTPWLARCENLQFLGDTIGMTLECEAQEHAVGDFSADIVCRDLNTDRYVLIENQIERTDHSHLGQLLTYAAGLKAAKVAQASRLCQTYETDHHPVEPENVAQSTKPASAKQPLSRDNQTTANAKAATLPAKRENWQALKFHFHNMVPPAASTSFMLGATFKYGWPVSGSIV